MDSKKIVLYALGLALSLQPATVFAQESGEKAVISPFDILPLPTAIQFPVVFDGELDSRTAAEGDKVYGHLREDLVFDGRLIAPAGSAIVGHIDHYVKSRNMTQAMSSSDTRFHKTSIVRLAFDEIITPDDNHIPIEGILSQQQTVFGDGVERQIVVNKKGVLQKAEQTLSDDTANGARIVNFSIGTGLSQLGGVASFGVLPVVMGAIGAVNPSIITMKAVTKEDKHPRLRGMTMGVVSSLPGGAVMQSLIYHGSELNIKKGDLLYVQAHSPYDATSTTTDVAGRLANKGSGGEEAPRKTRTVYPKYIPHYQPMAGEKVQGMNTNTEDRFGFWK